MKALSLIFIFLFGIAVAEAESSITVENYENQISLNTTYLYSAKPDFSFQQDDTFYKVYVKEKNVSFDKWSEGIKLHIDRLKQTDLTAVMFFVNENYVAEYSIFGSSSEFLDAQFEEVSSLLISKKINN